MHAGPTLSRNPTLDCRFSSCIYEVHGKPIMNAQKWIFSFSHSISGPLDDIHIKTGWSRTVPPFRYLPFAGISFPSLFLAYRRGFSVSKKKGRPQINEKPHRLAQYYLLESMRSKTKHHMLLVFHGRENIRGMSEGHECAADDIVSPISVNLY
jgi:hypothetical protein